MATDDDLIGSVENDPELRDLKKTLLEAQIRKTTAEAQRWEHEAKRSGKEIEVWDASSDEHRIYNFFGTVDGGNVAACMDVIGNWSRRNPECDISIIFNSPGGAVVHGLALYDFLDELKKNGHQITTVARGMAASTGGVLLQAGHERIIGANCHVLIHEVSTVNMGKISEIEDAVKFSKMLQERCIDILSERSTLTKAQIKTRWSRKDWWIGSNEAVELGFADKIG